MVDWWWTVERWEIDWLGLIKLGRILSLFQPLADGSVHFHVIFWMGKLSNFCPAPFFVPCGPMDLDGFGGIPILGHLHFLRNMAVLKVRMTFLFASYQVGAFALSPIAGVISQFGLFWPWWLWWHPIVSLIFDTHHISRENMVLYWTTPFFGFLIGIFQIKGMGMISRIYWRCF